MVPLDFFNAGLLQILNLEKKNAIKRSTVEGGMPVGGINGLPPPPQNKSMSSFPEPGNVNLFGKIILLT